VEVYPPRGARDPHAQILREIVSKRCQSVNFRINMGDFNQKTRGFSYMHRRDSQRNQGHGGACLSA